MEKAAPSGQGPGKRFLPWARASAKAHSRPRATVSVGIELGPPRSGGSRPKGRSGRPRNRGGDFLQGSVVHVGPGFCRAVRVVCSFADHARADRAARPVAREARGSASRFSRPFLRGRPGTAKVTGPRHGGPSIEARYRPCFGVSDRDGKEGRRDFAGVPCRPPCRSARAHGTERPGEGKCGQKCARAARRSHVLDPTGRGREAHGNERGIERGTPPPSDRGRVPGDRGGGGDADLPAPTIFHVRGDRARRSPNAPGQAVGSFAPTTAARATTTAEGESGGKKAGHGFIAVSAWGRAARSRFEGGARGSGKPRGPRRRWRSCWRQPTDGRKPRRTRGARARADSPAGRPASATTRRFCSLLPVPRRARRPGAGSGGGADDQAPCRKGRWAPARRSPLVLQPARPWKLKRGRRKIEAKTRVWRGSGAGPGEAPRRQRDSRPEGAPAGQQRRLAASK